MGMIGIPSGRPFHGRSLLVLTAVLAMMSPLLVATPAQAVVKAPLSMSAPVSVETNVGFTLAGYGYPAQLGREVVIQRQSGTSWIEVKRTAQSSAGYYSVATSVSGVGSFVYRAVTMTWRGANAVVSVSRVVSSHAPYILLAPSSAIAAETVKVTGKLPGVYSRPVWVQRKSGTTWVTIVKATTTSTGSYATSLKALAVGSYMTRAVAPQAIVAGKLKPQYVSGVKTLTVVAQTASLSMPGTLVQGATGIATITFSPVRAGRVVAFQVLKSGVWTTLASWKQASLTTGSFTVAAGTPGTYSYRGQIAAMAGAPAIVTPTRTLIVTPARIGPTTRTTLLSSSGTTSYDKALTLKASVAGTSGAPTGNVRFTDASNGSVLANEPLSGGVARLTTAGLAPGTRKIVASYAGDDVFSPSVSNSVIITVAPPQRTVATAFQNNSRHDGMDTGDTFNPATLHQAWSINLNQTSGSQTASVSYPLIAGGRVFVTVGPAPGSQGSANNLFALDATTGSVDWQAPISSTHGVLGLTYDGAQVFVQNVDGDMTAFDAASGQVNWSTTLSTPEGYSFTAPPTAYNGVLYASGSGGFGTLYAVSEANGEVVWSSSLRNGGAQSSPAVDDSGVYGGATAFCEKASAFGLNGISQWTKGLTGCSTGAGETLVLNESRVYLHGRYQSVDIPGRILSAVSGVGTSTFAGRRMPAFDTTNMYVVRDVAGGSLLDALDKSGSSTRWSFSGDGGISTTPVTTNGIVFTGSSSGNLYGIESSTGLQVWTAVAPGIVATQDGPGMSSGLAAADGLLAVPAGGFLTVYTS